MALEEEIRKRKRMVKKRPGENKVCNLVKNDDDNPNTEEPKGKRICVCKRCKKEFEQDYVPERNAYTDWKTCKECRKLLAESKTKKSGLADDGVSVATLPYEPYPWQIEAAKAFETHRFIVLSCGNRCLLRGAYINGADKLVEELFVGDTILNEFGKKQRVTRAEFAPYNGFVYTIKATGIEPIICNNEHPILIAHGRKKNRDSKAEVYDEKFVSAESLYEKLMNCDSLDRLYLKIPRVKGTVKCDKWEIEPLKKNYKNQILNIPINEETAWMIGLYCAEGCILENSTCKFTLSYKDTETADKLCSIIGSLNIHYHIRERELEGTRCVLVSKVQFARKLDIECGHGAKNKKIPQSILNNANEDILRSFLIGYYAGDGSYDDNTVKLRATTVSRTLAQQLQTAWATIGHHAKITSKQREKKKKNGENCSLEYVVEVSDRNGVKKLGYSTRKKNARETSIVTDGCIYVKINSVKREEKNTEIVVITTEDGTFVANNVVNHNCGKDRFSIMTSIKYFVECLNENRAIDNPEMVPSVMWWIIAPIEPLARQIWRELKAYFPTEWIVSCSNSTYQIETIGGGVIEVRSGYDPNMLVGVGLDLVTITEAARFKDLEFAWANLEGRLNSEGRGRKKDRRGSEGGQGKAIINSSPLPGRNGFYHLYQYGQISSPTYSSDWWSCQYPWTANPTNNELAKKIIHTRYGDITYEESLKRQMGERLYNLNYMGRFDVAEGSVFKNFEDKCVINVRDPELGLDTKKKRQEFVRTWRRVDPVATYVGGYDPATGSSGDSPTFVIRNKDTNRIVRIFDLYGKNYEAQWDFIASMCKKYNYATIFWLRTGHTACEGQFAKRGIAEQPFDENGGKKAELVQKLELAVENEDIQVLADGSVEAQTLISQMNDYTEKNGKYSNNEQPHDDFVSALYCAYGDYTVADVPVSYCGLFGKV